MLIEYFRKVVKERYGVGSGREPVLYYGRYRLERTDHLLFLSILWKNSFIVACMIPFLLLELGLKLLFSGNWSFSDIELPYFYLEWLDRHIYSVILRQEILNLSALSFQNLLKSSREMKPNQHLVLLSCGHWLLFEPTLSVKTYAELSRSAIKYLEDKYYCPVKSHSICWSCSQKVNICTIISEKTYRRCLLVNQDNINIDVCPISGTRISINLSKHIRDALQGYLDNSLFDNCLSVIQFVPKLFFQSGSNLIGMLACGHWALLDVTQRWYLKHFYCFYCRTPRSSLDLSEPYVFKHYLTYSEPELNGPGNRIYELSKFYLNLVVDSTS